MDHPAVIEFDAARHCYVHFCPEAGLVTVPNTDLASFLFRPGWLVNWLAQELHAVCRASSVSYPLPTMSGTSAMPNATIHWSRLFSRGRFQAKRHWITWHLRSEPFTSPTKAW